MSAKLSVKNTIKICIITISLVFVLLSASFAGAFMRDIGESIPTVETAFAADVDGGRISNPVFGKNTFSTGALPIPDTETNGEKDAITYRIDFPINDDHDLITTLISISKPIWTAEPLSLFIFTTRRAAD